MTLDWQTKQNKFPALTALHRLRQVLHRTETNDLQKKLTLFVLRILISPLPTFDLLHVNTNSLNMHMQHPLTEVFLSMNNGQWKIENPNQEQQ